MDEHSLLVLMSVFVLVAAVALTIQAGYLFGIYKTIRAMHENTSRMLPKVESLVVTSHAALEEGRVTAAALTVKAHAILDVSQKQLQTVDAFLTDATERGRVQLDRAESFLEDATARGRVQMDRAEMFLDDTMGRAQDTVAMVHSTVIAPIRQINGLATGVRAALQFLLRGNRPSPDRATVDEEMFI